TLQTRACLAQTLSARLIVRGRLRRGALQATLSSTKSRPYSSVKWLLPALITRGLLPLMHHHYQVRTSSHQDHRLRSVAKDVLPRNASSGPRPGFNQPGIPLPNRNSARLDCSRESQASGAAAATAQLIRNPPRVRMTRTLGATRLNHQSFLGAVKGKI